jgi:hypothetical protein
MKKMTHGKCPKSITQGQNSKSYCKSIVPPNFYFYYKIYQQYKIFLQIIRSWILWLRNPIYKIAIKHVSCGYGLRRRNKPLIISTASLTPKVLGDFHQNCLKTTLIQSKIDCAKSESLLVHLIVRSCS